MDNRSPQYPTDMASYVRRMEANTHQSGHGLGNVFMHYPCPFCGSPEWAKIEISATARELAKDHECGECGRRARAIFTHPEGADLGTMDVEMVQTGGPDQEDWYEPKMRRISV